MCAMDEVRLSAHIVVAEAIGNVICATVEALSNVTYVVDLAMVWVVSSAQLAMALV
jgi:hypothetical protein